MPVDIVVYNAKLFVESQILEGGLAIEKGKIIKLGKEANLPYADRKIDVKGLLILPGLVDAHVHLRDQHRSLDEDFYTGTSAAVAGGITTVLDMPNNDPVTMDVDSLKERKRLAKSSVLANVGFFSAFPESFETMSKIVEEGAVGFKLYLQEQIGGLNIDDDKQLTEAFTKAGELCVPIAVHAEERKRIEETSMFERRCGENGIDSFLRVHSPEIEAQAVKRILQLPCYSSQVHFCHISSEKSLALIRNANNAGLNVSCEVTPHHIFLSDETLRQTGLTSLTDPPFRSPSVRDRLWSSLKDSEIDIVASDHAPHSIKNKMASSIWDVKPGVPGLETELPLLLTKVNEGLLTIWDVVRLMAEKPAEIFNLQGVGFLKEGYDANLTIVNLHQHSKVDPSKFHSKAKYSPFEGWALKGMPERVFVNGCEVMKEGEIISNPGVGRILS